MSLIATCPKCSTSANVTAEFNGKKVRCKKCKALFVVEAKPATGRPKSASAKAPSGIHPKGKQKSNAPLWIGVGVVAFLVIVGGAAAVFMSQSEPAKQAKTAKKKTDEVAKSGKGKQFIAQKAASGEKSNLAEFARGEKRDASKTAAVETKLEPSVVAPLLKSMPIECKDFADVQEVFSIANKPSRIGVRLIEKDRQRFHLYDLDKHERVANFEIEKNVYVDKEKFAALDIDPDGEFVAMATVENRLHFYGLPQGGDQFEDDWAPYSDIKNEMRFLGESGRIVGIHLLSKDLCLTITSNNNGNLWEWSKKRPQYFIPAIERLEFQKPNLVRDADFVLSPDRSLLAIAADEGVRLMDAKEFKELGKTPKLTKYGTKPAVGGIGFDPAGKSIGVSFSAGTKDGRSYFYAKFAVPGGEELSIDPVADPGAKSTIEYVNSEMYLSLDRREGVLRTAKGKSLAQFRFSPGGGLFARKLASNKLAFAFVGEKDKPHVGLVEVPMAEASTPIAVATPTPGAAPAKMGGSSASLEDLLLEGKKEPEKNMTKQPAQKQPQAAPKIDPDRQAIWQFGPKGIVKTGFVSR